MSGRFVARHRLCGAALTLALGLVPSVAVANAWVRPQGDGLAIAKYSYWSSTDAFDAERARQPFPENAKSTLDQLNLYLEYGWSDELTLIGNFFLNSASYQSDSFSGTTTSLGDQEFGLRYRLDPTSSADSPWVGAVQGLISVPAYDSGREPAAGPGGPGIELRYSVGRHFQAARHAAFIDAGAAVRLRGGKPADELRFDVVNGVYFTPRWLGLAEFNLIQGLGNGKGYTPSNFIDSNNYDLMKLQLSLAPGLTENTRLQFGYEYDLCGRNTGAGSGPFIALWLTF